LPETPIAAGASIIPPPSVDADVIPPIIGGSQNRKSNEISADAGGKATATLDDGFQVDAEKSTRPAGQAAPEKSAAALPPSVEQTPSRRTTPRTHAERAGIERSIPQHDSSNSAAPAVARANQIDAGIRLENTTGQGTTPNTQTTTIPNVSPQLHYSSATLPKMPSPETLTAKTFAHAESDDAANAPFANRIVRGLSTMVNQRGGVMKMRLDPPELGDLRVQMTLNRGVVTAEFQASSTQAHSLLERNLATLRNALEAQGLTVDRLTVHAPASSATNLNRDDASQGGTQQSARQHHDAGGGESRGRRDDTPRQPQPAYRSAAFSTLMDADTSNDIRDLLAAG